MHHRDRVRAPRQLAAGLVLPLLGCLAGPSPRAAGADASPDAAPTCGLLAGDQALPNRISADPSGTVYWANRYAGEIVRLAPGESTPVPVVTGQNQPLDLELDGDTLYWVSYGTKTIWRRLPGDVPRLFAEGDANPRLPFVVDPDWVYWVDYGAGTSAADGRIRRARKAGGSPETLVPALVRPTGVVARAGFVYYSVRGTTGNSDGTIQRLNLSNGSVSVLRSGEDRPNALAVDDTHVYFVDIGSAAASGAVKRYRLADQAVNVLATGQRQPALLALSSSDVYFINLGTAPEFLDGSVMSVARDGSAMPRHIAWPIPAPSGVFATPTHIYFTSSGTEVNGFLDGSVRCVPR